MKTLTVPKTVFAALLCGVVALTVTACSDDKPEKPTASASAAAAPAKPTHNPNPFDHSGDIKVTDSEKQKFEQEFAAQCVAREVHNSGNPEDKARFDKPCTCIATFLMKDLTYQEAEKFLTEHENPQSLRIKYENAAYHCLQEKTPPKEPDFSRPAPAAVQ